MHCTKIYCIALKYTLLPCTILYCIAETSREHLVHCAVVQKVITTLLFATPDKMQRYEYSALPLGNTNTLYSVLCLHYVVLHYPVLISPLHWNTTALHYSALHAELIHSLSQQPVVAKTVIILRANCQDYVCLYCIVFTDLLIYGRQLLLNK